MKQSKVQRVIVKGGKAVIQLSCGHEQARDSLFGSVSTLANTLQGSLVGRLIDCDECEQEAQKGAKQ
jgi:hypothetical protein